MVVELDLSVALCDIDDLSLEAALAATAGTRKEMPTPSLLPFRGVFNFVSADFNLQQVILQTHTYSVSSGIIHFSLLSP